MTHIAGFDLRLPGHWHPLPGPVPHDDRWATDLAATILAGVDAPVEDAEALVARQLLEVRRSVDATGATNLRLAVLVADPTSLLIDALVTASMERDVSLETYAARLDTVAAQVDDAQVMGVQPIEAEISVGRVRGAQYLIGHLSDDEADGVSPLEERVHLGVVPHGTTDIVDVMVIAANPTYFEDLPTTAVTLLGGLDVQTGAPA